MCRVYISELSEGEWQNFLIQLALGGFEPPSYSTATRGVWEVSADDLQRAEQLRAGIADSGLALQVLMSIEGDAA